MTVRLTDLVIVGKVSVWEPLKLQWHRSAVQLRILFVSWWSFPSCYSLSVNAHLGRRWWLWECAPLGAAAAILAVAAICARLRTKHFPPLTLSPLASYSCFPVPLVLLRLMNITVRGCGEKYKSLMVRVQHSNVWIVRWCNDDSESPVSVSFTFSNSRCKNRCNYAAVVMCERFSPLDWWLRVISVCVGRVFWPAEIVKALPE